MNWKAFLPVLLSLFVMTYLDCTSTPRVTDSGSTPETLVEQAPKAKAFPKTWTALQPALAATNDAYPYMRSIIHLHSVYSHDACDGKPQENGKVNEPCLQRLREALCKDKIDVAYLTEHKTWMAKGHPLEKMLLYVEGSGDVKIEEGGQMFGNTIHCKDGHQVHIFAGAENVLMPIGLKKHPTMDGKGREEVYGASTPEAIKAFKEAGAAAVLIAHTEQHDLEYLRTHALTGIEIFNLHAILDPRIRPKYLNLPGETAIAEFGKYVSNKEELPHPDLVFLGFLVPMKVMLEKWDKLLVEKMVFGVGGTDAHENVLQSKLIDGDRPDSYARMMRWFSNHLRVEKRDWQSARKAVSSGQHILVFELLGTPLQFDFYGMTAAGKRVEMGTSTKEKLASFHVKALHPYHNGEEPVDAMIKLLKIDASGTQTAAEGKNSLELKAPGQGAYRVEVSVTPKHFKHLLTSATQHYMHSFPWIYSNPIRVEP